MSQENSQDDTQRNQNSQQQCNKKQVELVALQVQTYQPNTVFHQIFQNNHMQFPNCISIFDMSNLQITHEQIYEFTNQNKQKLLNLKKISFTNTQLVPIQLFFQMFIELFYESDNIKLAMHLDKQVSQETKEKINKQYQLLVSNNQQYLQKLLQNKFSLTQVAIHQELYFIVTKQSAQEFFLQIYFQKYGDKDAFNHQILVSCYLVNQNQIILDSQFQTNVQQIINKQLCYVRVQNGDSPNQKIIVTLELDHQVYVFCFEN